MADAAGYQTLFDGLIAQHGGLAALSPVHVEIVSVICKLLVAVREAEPGDVLEAAGVVAKLTAQLPPPVTAAATKLDLTLLSDSDLSELQRIYAVGSGEQPPTPEPIVVERERGASEIEGAALGRFIDEHCERWLHGGLTAGEANTLRNGYQAMSRGFIARNLWRSLWQAEFESSVAERVSAAVHAVDGSAEVVKPTPFERRIAGGVHDAAKGALLGPGNGQSGLDAYGALFTHTGGGASRFDNRG